MNQTLFAFFDRLSKDLKLFKIPFGFRTCMSTYPSEMGSAHANSASLKLRKLERATQGCSSTNVTNGST